jgi:hypothetical protein
MQLELKTNFKTTLEKLKENGWELTECAHANAKFCTKKINEKDIATIYDNQDKCLYVSIYDNFADLNFASTVCEELKKLEIE